MKTKHAFRVISCVLSLLIALSLLSCDVRKIPSKTESTEMPTEAKTEEKTQLEETTPDETATAAISSTSPESATETETETASETNETLTSEIETEAEITSTETSTESEVEETSTSLPSLEETTAVQTESETESSSETVAPHTHKSSKWIVDKEPTCKSAGSKHKECTDCKIVLETDTIEKLKTHREGTKQIEIEKGLFCGNSGEYSATVNCIDCGDIISVGKYELPKKHKMSNNVCEICGLPQSSTNGGMTFYLKPDGTYLVTTSSKAIDENIVIGVYNDISVTEINGGAFSERIDIKSITIAYCVTTIGEMAFYNCTSIKNVSIGNGVSEIPDETFWGCTSLRSVSLGDNIKTIGYRAFKGCSNLYYVYITGAYDWKLRSERGNTTTVYGSWIAKEDNRQGFAADYLLEYVAYKWTRK